MSYNKGGLNLTKYWRFWGLNFGIHMIIGIAAIFAGVTVVITIGEVLNGLALIGAGGFAIINGWQGFVDLGRSTVNQLHRNTTQNNR